ERAEAAAEDPAGGRERELSGARAGAAAECWGCPLPGGSGPGSIKGRPRPDSPTAPRTEPMALLAPPPAPPRVATCDNDDARRFRMRVVQVMATMVTLLVTAWL